MTFDKEMKFIGRSIWLPFILSCLPLFGWSQISGNGNLDTQIRSTDLFTTLVVEIPGDVEIVCQSLPHVEITTDDNLLEYIETKIWGNELRIKSTADIRPTHRTKIKIGTAFLHKLETAVCEDHYRVTNIETASFELINMTAETVLEGSAEDFKLVMESGNCYGDNFATQNTFAQIWGGGLGSAQVSNELSGVINQGSRFAYLGEPAKIKASVKNGSKLKSGNDFPDLNLAQKRQEVIKEIESTQKLDIVPAKEEKVEPKNDNNKSTITLNLYNNSKDRVHVSIVGPRHHRFSYEAPFNPGYKRVEEFPVGTKVYLLGGFGRRKLLVTIKAEDANQDVPLFQ